MRCGLGRRSPRDCPPVGADCGALGTTRLFRWSYAAFGGGGGYWGVFGVSWKGRFGVFLRCFWVPGRHQGGKACFLTLTYVSKNPEKQGVYASLKKHENFFKKPLASKTLF